VYFSSDRTGRFEIWRAPVDGGGATQVTHDGGVTSLESFDGRTLYYVKTHSGPQPLFARTLGAPGERKAVAAILGLDFAVDETGVLYFERGAKPGAISLRHLDPETGSTREVTTLDVLPTVGFSVSRDGRTFLFAAQKPADDDLYLIDNFR
jgi:Tol biopolymer transport system component